MKEEYKKKYAISELNLLEKYHKEGLITFPLNSEDKHKLIIACMSAIKTGNYKSLKYLLEQDRSILSEKESGIFRMTAEIEDYINFKNTIDYLFEKDDKQYINLSANENGFLKEIIKKNKKPYIQYITEEHKKVFNVNDENLFKILVRNQNKEMFNYFILDLNMTIKETVLLKEWLLENNYESELIQIQKRNLFNKLQADLKEKSYDIRSKKL